MTTTWNPSDAGSGKFTFSNGNLTATSIGSTNAWNCARSTTSQTGGKWYFEWTNVEDQANFGQMIGLANATAALSNFAGADTNGISFQSGGGVYFNNVEVVAGGGGNGYGVNAVAGVAVDLTNNLLWAFSPGTGEWNSSLTANPATGTGGVSFSSLGAAFLAVSMNPVDGTESGTLNAGATSFAHSLPTGFAAWNTPASASSQMFIGA